jgi:hypothetical protein
MKYTATRTISLLAIRNRKGAYLNARKSDIRRNPFQSSMKESKAMDRVVNQTPFLFAIPLRSRAVSRDWKRVCNLLSRTLSSILGQTDQNFYVAVGCHELPELTIPPDPHVVFLQTSAAIPTALAQQGEDKKRKRRLALAYLRTLGGGYFMPLDADDLVSQRLVQYVRSNPPQFGYIMNKGYELDSQTGRVKYAPRFSKFCGSCAIFRFSAEDLPSSEADGKEYVADKFGDHIKWKEVGEKLKRPLSDLPIRGAMYVTNNGENYSVLSGNVGWRRTILRRLTPARKPSSELVAEFGL